MGIKGPEIRTQCKGNVDRSVIMCLEALAEDNAQRKQEIVSVALLADRCIDAVSTMVSVNYEMSRIMEANGIDVSKLADMSASEAVQNKESMVKSEDMKDDDTKY